MLKWSSVKQRIDVCMYSQWKLAVTNSWKCISYYLNGLGPGLFFFWSYFLVSLKSLHCPCRSCWLSRLSFFGQSFQAGRHAIPRLSQLLWVLWEIYRFLRQIPHFPADTAACFPCSKSLLSHFISPFSPFFPVARLLLLFTYHQNSLLFIPGLLAFSFRHHSCYVCLFICGYMQAFLIFCIYPP